LSSDFLSSTFLLPSFFHSQFEKSYHQFGPIESTISLLSAKSPFSQTTTNLYLLIQDLESQFSVSVFEASTEIVFSSHEGHLNNILYPNIFSEEYLFHVRITLYQSIFHFKFIDFFSLFSEFGFSFLVFDLI
jgi:hypothetical protein